MIIATHGIVASAGGIDPDAQAFFDRVTTAGGSLSLTEKTAVNKLVQDLKSYSIWSKMKAIYPMVGASAAACAQNLKSSSFTGTFNGGWTYASTGVTGNKTNTYIDIGLIPSSTLILNSTHISLYVRNTGDLGIDDFGARVSATSSFRTQIKELNTNRFLLQQYSDAEAIDLPNGVPDSRGFFVLTRESSTSLTAVRNNSTLGTNTNTSTGTLPNIKMVIGALNLNGSIVIPSSKEYAFASIGDGLNSTERGNFYTAVNAFQTTLSRNV